MSKASRFDPLFWVIVFVVLGWFLFGCATTKWPTDSDAREHATFMMKACARGEVVLFYQCQAEVMTFCRDSGLEKTCWEAW